MHKKNKWIPLVFSSTVGSPFTALTLVNMLMSTVQYLEMREEKREVKEPVLVFFLTNNRD